MDQAVLENLKKILLAEREKFTRELKGIAKPDPKRKGGWRAIFPQFELFEYGASSGRDEEADEVEEFETILAAEDNLASRLLSVNRALNRMEKGTYGICQKCGKEIPLERLQANPAAEYDIEHS